MKNFFKPLIIVFSLLAFVACNEDDNRFSVDSESGWVQFVNNSTIDLAYGTIDEVRIPVNLNSVVNANGLDVTYSIVDVVGSSAPYLINNGVFTIEKGTLKGELVFGLSTTVPLTSSIEFDVVLSTTSRSNVSIGLSDNSRPVVKRFRICPINFAATYRGVPTNSLGTVGPAFTATFTPVVGQTNAFNVDTLWGQNYIASLTGSAAQNGRFINPGILSLVPTSTNVNVVGLTPNFSTGGTGSIDACSGVIKVTVDQRLFGNPFTVTTVFTPI